MPIEDMPPVHAAADGVRLTLRAHYAPWPFLLDQVELRFDLAAEHTVVHSRLHLRRRAEAPPTTPLTLRGRDLHMSSLRLDGRELTPQQFTVADDNLVLAQVPAAFMLEVVTELNPGANLAGKGLFVLDRTLATHMEAEGLSRVTYFPDRPDVLARYRVTLAADRQRYPVLLSNGNQVASTVLADGRHEVVWDDPHPKPSYIFALVAGDLGCLRGSHTTPSGREVQIAIHAPARFVGQCQFALQALQRAMRWDEARYGLECDVDEYQVAALPGFPGAQENKGLNLYELAGIVADPDITTDEEALTIERIIAHEYFHNWTGNRVTCRDWFQLSLKEGLTRYRDQTYIDELLGPGVYRIDTVRTLMRNQFPEDDGPGRHPIRPDFYADVEELYTATVYEKGAEVIRMLHTLLGDARFIAGVRDYLHRHDGTAATCEDFVAAMERAGGRDLSQFRLWYAQAGRPRVTVQCSRDPATRRLTLTLSQRLPAAQGGATPLPMHIPVRVSLVDPQTPDEPPASVLLELRQAEQCFDFEGVAPGTVLSVLEGFSAPVTVEPFLDEGEQLTLLRHAHDPCARWQAGQRVTVAAIHALASQHHEGQLLTVSPALLDTYAELLDQTPDNSLLTAELLRLPDEPVLSEGLARIDVEGHAAGRAALRAALGRRLKPALWALATATGHGDDRALMNTAGMGRRRLAAVALDLLIATGDSDVADLCQQRALHAATMTERFDALCCLVDFDGPQREEALAGFLHRWQDQPTVVCKWFAAQAGARGPGALDRIMALQAHPKFDMNNLALVMAYFGGFFRQNRVSFHDRSGRAYVWLADLLLTSDRMGRSGGVWLTPQLSQWRRHDPDRSALMHSELVRIQRTPGISNALRGLAQRLLSV